jgi:hypothetical protein
MSFSINNILNTNDTNGPYETDPSRWYKSYPYGFAFFDATTKPGELAKQTFWLPIAPNNINITTHYATNIVTTLYGVIEEHSEVRYYDIVISGNTGIAPKYVTPFAVNSTTGSQASLKIPGVPLPNPLNPGTPSMGRTSFEPGLASKLSGALGGFLPEVSNTISAAANLASNIVGGNANETGIRPEQSGYYAFHNFYKFLLRYKNDAARTSDSSMLQGFVGPLLPGSLPLFNTQKRETHPLQFLNYKDQVRYDVVPISFTMTRSAENPMLYNYSIRMRGFNLQNVNASVAAENLKAQLGLEGFNGSLFSSMTDIAGNASTLVSGIAGIF